MPPASFGKSPLLAALITVFFPGFGHVYCGGGWRGVAVMFGFYLSLFLLSSIHYAVSLAAIPILFGFAARDAWLCAKAAAVLEQKELAAAVPPRKWAIGLWVAARALWITTFPVLIGGLLLVGAVYDARHGRTLAGLISAGVASVLLCVAVFASREAWAVLAGFKPAAERSLLAEVTATAVVMGVCLLLFAVVAPGYSGLFRKGAEGAVRGNLALLRDGVERYRVSHDGRYPVSLETLVQVRTLEDIPLLWPTFSESVHPKTISTIVVYSTVPADTGQWAYVVSADSPGASGAVFIDCTHTDTKGSYWTGY